MYYQVGTNNKSFIEMFNILKKLGVKNNKFFLRLNNPLLDDVDPWVSDLDSETKLAIIKECSENFWYFIREVLKWKAPEGGYSQVSIDRGTLATHYLASNSIDIWRTVVRQLHSTKNAESFLFWNYLFCANSKIDNISCNPLQHMALRTSDMFEGLPEFMYKQLIENTGVMNIERRKNDLLNTVIQNVNIPKGKMSIERGEIIGQRLNSNLCLYDDAEFIPYLSSIIESQAPIFSEIKTKCLDNMNASRMFLSTRGEKNAPNTAFVKKLLFDSLLWVDIYYDLDISSLKEEIQNKSKSGIVHIKYNYSELGLDDEWFGQMCACLNYNADCIKREIMCEWA